jgi:hypothetical protein
MNKILLIVLFLVVVFVIVRWQGKQYNDFLANSEKISGVIIKKEERVRRSDQPNRKEYFISYSYSVDGKEYVGSDNFEFRELWSEIREGQAVDINYLKSDPSQSHLYMLLKLRMKSTSPE